VHETDREIAGADGKATAYRLKISLCSQSELGLLASSDAFNKEAVGAWSSDRYMLEMSSPSSRCLLFRGGDGDIAGAALLRNLTTDPSVELARLLVIGHGDTTPSLLCEDLMKWIFEKTDINRIEVRVPAPDQDSKARFEAAGFQVEGVLRESCAGGDTGFAAMWLMSILRREWTERRSRTADTIQDVQKTVRPRRGGIL
jgi:hypothetical protein